jgi:predicted nucleic-acid-binding Zn-ribbon protein
MICPKCGGNLKDVKKVQIPLEPFEGCGDGFQDGFTGVCDNCGYEDVWYDM